MKSSLKRGIWHFTLRPKDASTEIRSKRLHTQSNTTTYQPTKVASKLKGFHAINRILQRFTVWIQSHTLHTQRSIVYGRTERNSLYRIQSLHPPRRPEAHALLAISHKKSSVNWVYSTLYIYNTNQRNPQFSKFVFNVWCLLHVSKLVG